MKTLMDRLMKKYILDTFPDTVEVILFKPIGKYYTTEEWHVPEEAIGPYDMVNSIDCRSIGGGPVLVPTQEPWGYPHLLQFRMKTKEERLA